MQDTITINKKSGTCLTRDIGNIELGDLTVFAGLNNAGKTTLIDVIIKMLKDEGKNVIEIPAEKVIPDEQLKTGVSDPFTQSLTDIIDATFDPNSINSHIDDITESISKEFDKYKVENTSIKVNTKSATNDDYIKSIKETYIKKLIDTVCIRDDYIDKDNIKISKSGQGTQRLFIVALLKYLGTKKSSKSSTKSTYIFFEEPEIYLHPKLKESLYENLSIISSDKKNNIKVVITTHDPYFIELGKDKKHIIYKVFRDGNNGNSTNVSRIENRYLDYTSASEINYLIFDIATKSYFLELYECKKSKKHEDSYYWEFDKDLSQELGIIQDEHDKNGNSISYITKLRHDLAHPNDNKDDSFSKKGHEAIKKLITCL